MGWPRLVGAMPKATLGRWCDAAEAAAPPNGRASSRQSTLQTGNGHLNMWSQHLLWLAGGAAAFETWAAGVRYRGARAPFAVVC